MRNINEERLLAVENTRRVSADFVFSGLDHRATIRLAGRGKTKPPSRKAS